MCMEKLIGIQEAARLLGVCRQTLIRWDKKGKLRAYKTLGKHRRYKVSELEQVCRKEGHE